MDQVVYLEPDVIRAIPQAPRLCDTPNLRKEKVRIGDCNLYCEQEGQGAPLVLLHGGPGATHHHFHPYFSQAAPFARVIYYDQRGCGLSDYQPGQGYSVDQAVDDLDRLRQALGFDQWIVLGHSYGGFLAQYYATKHPEDIKGLVLLCASTGLHGESLPSRQYDFLTPQEQQKMSQIRKTPGLSMAQLVYNNHLNGDWKRQNYYKPTREQLAQTALYGWVHDFDQNFNGVMSRSEDAVDLEGAFAQCPLPTLILEGKWDLTWNTDKPERFHKNHPNAKLVMFEASGHSPFEDEPDRFFRVLRDFVTTLAPGSPAERQQWKDEIEKWRQRKRAVRSAFLQTPVGPREREIVRHLEQGKNEALQGRKFQGQSTPAEAFLTGVSAFYHQDAGTLLQVLPIAGQQLQESSAQMRATLLDSLAKTTICRIEVEDRPPQEADLAAMYTTDAPDKEINQVFMFCYTQGAWRFLGSASNLVNNWRPAAAAAEKQTRALLQQKTPETP